VPPRIDYASGMRSETALALCFAQIRCRDRCRVSGLDECPCHRSRLARRTRRVQHRDAGAFEVVSKEPNAFRKPRPPITALRFTLEGEREPLTAQLIGQPSRINVVRAALEIAPAKELLAALHDAQEITISLSYLDGASDTLILRNWVPPLYVPPSLVPVNAGDAISGINFLHSCLERLGPVPGGPSGFTAGYVPGVPINYPDSDALKMRLQ